MEVTLVDHTHDPIKTLYEAFKVCYAEETPQETEALISEGTITREGMERFLIRMSSLGHSSPYQQVWFEFAVSGISRSCSHQLITHHVGMSKTQQSQRYVDMLKWEPVIPPTISKMLDDTYKVESNEFVEPPPGYDAASEAWWQAIEEIRWAYRLLVEAGIPEEDARYILPNATPTNLKITINLRQLQMCCDERLCTTAQWEIRKLFSLIRKEVVTRWPIFASMLGPKCLEARGGMCTESWETYVKCPLHHVRPHKTALNHVTTQQDKVLELLIEEVEDYAETTSGS